MRALQLSTTGCVSLNKCTWFFPNTFLWVDLGWKDATGNSSLLPNCLLPVCLKTERDKNLHQHHSLSTVVGHRHLAKWWLFSRCLRATLHHVIEAQKSNVSALWSQCVSNFYISVGSILESNDSAVSPLNVSTMTQHIKHLLYFTKKQKILQTMITIGKTWYMFFPMKHLLTSTICSTRWGFWRLVW